MAPTDELRLWQARLPVSRVAAMAVLTGVVAFLPLLAVTRAYIDERRAVFQPAPAEQPAIVLLPNRVVYPWAWPMQGKGYNAYATDFTRNGTDPAQPVIYGRIAVPDAVARACRLGRAVYEWRQPGALTARSC